MLHPGHRLGDRYRLEARIGAGGMGEVWRAVDEVLGRVVAVKAMLPTVAGDPDFARRFLIEAKAMARVNHPAVASIHDYGSSDGVTYLVMEFVDGQSLAQILRDSGPLPPAETMRLTAQAADGLQAVHDCGIVHRDIKPANLLVRRDGALVITDFGISRPDDGSHLTVSGAILGTPTYLSPEQVLGKPATPLSDVYSLGLTAYECLAGHKPFSGDNPYAVALQRLQVSPRTLAGNLPGPVIAVIERALAADPGDRWPSAAALAGAARSTALPSPPVAALQVGSAPPVKRRMWALVAAVLAVALLGGGWFLSKINGDADVRAKATVSSPADDGLASAGLATCAAGLCPVEPLCWHGMTAINGRALPPGKVDCDLSHTWETFAAIRMPVDAAGAVPGELMKKADIAQACAASVMQSRSVNPARTKDWINDAWPVQIDGTNDWLVHCLARPATADAMGAAFTTA
jgi:serine/threonine-protein kinase